MGKPRIAVVSVLLVILLPVACKKPLGETETVPAAPTNVQASDGTYTDRVRVTWTVASGATAYKVYSATSVAGLKTTLSTSTVATSYDDYSASVGTTCYYFVKASNSAGDSPYSSHNSGYRSAAVSIPAAPTNVQASDGTYTDRVRVTWTAASGATAYKVYSATSVAGLKTTLSTSTVGTSYDDYSASVGTTSYYFVKASNSAGDSPYSSYNSGYRSAAATIPSAPTNPTISSITTNGATFSWTDTSDNETGFQIGSCSGPVQVGRDGVRTCLSGFTQIAQLGANATSYTFTGLSPNAQYSRFVRAYNSAGNSDNSGTLFATALGRQTVTLQAIASNVVISNSLDSTKADTAYPNSYPAVGINWYSTLAGYSNSLAFAGLVKYNVSSLVGRTIISATLNLEVHVAPVGGYSQNFDIGTVASSWSPATVTWNGIANFLYYTAGWKRNNSYPTFSGQPYSIDLTTVVKSWADGTFDNYGIGFLSSNYSIRPGNVDSLDAYEFYVPTLTVTYQ